MIIRIIKKLLQQHEDHSVELWFYEELNIRPTSSFMWENLKFHELILSFQLRDISEK